MRSVESVRGGTVMDKLQFSMPKSATLNCATVEIYLKILIKQQSENERARTVGVTRRRR
jgi:hypothetical protein